MSTDRFTAAMGYIDDDLISDAVTYMPKKKEHKFKWMKLIAAAACICLVVATFFPFFQQIVSSSAASAVSRFFHIRYSFIICRST